METTTPTPEQIAAAQAVLDAAQAAKYYPEGSNLVSTWGGVIILGCGKTNRRDNFRELTVKEVDAMRTIPECSKALEGK